MPLSINDELCLKIARFLSNYLNTAFNGCYGEDYPDLKIVKGIEQYNKLQVQLDHFPLLKVYRISDTYKNANSYRTTEIEIAYCCAFAEVDILPGLLSFVAKHLVEGVAAFAMSNQRMFPTREDITPMRVNYQIAVNEFTNQTYPFLNTRIMVNDLCDRC